MNLFYHWRNMHLRQSMANIFLHQCVAGKIQQFKLFSHSHMTVIVNRKHRAAELWR